MPTLFYVPLDALLAGLLVLGFACWLIHKAIGDQVDQLFLLGSGSHPAVELDIDLSDVDWSFPDREMVA